MVGAAEAGAAAMTTGSIWAVGDAVVGAMKAGGLGTVDAEWALWLTVVHHVLLIAWQDAAALDGAGLGFRGVRAVLA
jgi:hypothetical protein